ncbi:hypothetical protein HZC21_03530 [Candidatus Peregrinibacteria bacterium]|nr:hypothetical protein [Candidatus Peregrinibacteria bacterium]
MKNKGIDVGYIIRVFACILAFIATIIYFSYSCRILVNNYLTIITVPWLINFAVASILFIIILSVTVVLLRPFWIAISVYGLGAILYAFIVGFSIAAWIAAAVFLVSLILYLFFEIGQLNNQIKFSTHPLGDKKILICSLLAMMISVALGIGYYQDSIKRNYVVPPETKTFILQQVMKGVEKQKQKQAAVKQIEEKLKTMINDAEKSLKPYQKYIPIALGILSFLLFQIVLFFISFISAIFIPLVFWLLKVTHFAHTAVEKRKTQHLTLKTIL